VGGTFSAVSIKVDSYLYDNLILWLWLRLWYNGSDALTINFCFDFENARVRFETRHFSIDFENTCVPFVTRHFGIDFEIAGVLFVTLLTSVRDLS
jgi:hypothetical protein